MRLIQNPASGAFYRIVCENDNGYELDTRPVLSWVAKSAILNWPIFEVVERVGSTENNP